MADPRTKEKQEAAITAAIALATVYAAVRTNVLDRVARGVRAGLLLPHWRRRVAAVNGEQLKRISADVARSISDTVSVSRMDQYLEDAANGRADGWEEATQALLEQIDTAAENFEAEVREAMDEMVSAAPDDARDIAESAVEFGSIEAEKANGRTTKTWNLGAGDNHRASHIALNGVTIGIDERFANGLRYPHAPGPPAETVNCNCFLTYGGGDA